MNDFLILAGVARASIYKTVPPMRLTESRFGPGVCLAGTITEMCVHVFHTSDVSSLAAS